MESLFQLVTAVPSEAWVGLMGVISGSLLTILGVWLTNRANTEQLKMQLQHEERLHRQQVTKERLEELHILVNRWLNLSFGSFLHLRLVMKGETDYNQYLDTFIKTHSDEKTDFGRLDMIVDIYGADIKDAYDRVMNTRSQINEIESDHKKAYQLGKPGWPFIDPLSNAYLQLEKDGHALKEVIADAARNA